MSNEQPKAEAQAVPIWRLITPEGNIAATETTCIRAWARIDGYKPTVEGLLGYEEKGWRVTPTDSAANAGAVPSDAEILALNIGERFFSESRTKYPEAGHGTQYHAGAPGVIGFAREVLALAPKADSSEPRACPYCDDTGDVHGVDGEWRGACTACDANKIATPASAQAGGVERIKPTKIEPGSEPHFNLLGSQWHFNLLSGTDYANWQAYSRLVWKAALSAAQRQADAGVSSTTIKSMRLDRERDFKASYEQGVRDGLNLRPPANRVPLTQGEVDYILSRSKLREMHHEMGWYSSPEKNFRRYGAALARDIETAVRNKLGIDPAPKDRMPSPKGHSDD